ncbi:hypothetical protein AAG906_016046 [Vitis piasezkii]
MPELMLVVSAELKNVVILQPQDGIDNETINYYFKVNFQCCFDLTLFYILTLCLYKCKKKNPLGNERNDNLNLSRKCQGCERHGAILLIPGHGAPLSQHHCTEVDLMLFNCNGLLSVEYSFNGGWLSFGKEIHVDLSMAEYRDVIDGEEVSITKLKAKFVSYWN